MKKEIRIAGQPDGTMPEAPVHRRTAPSFGSLDKGFKRPPVLRASLLFLLLAAPGFTGCGTVRGGEGPLVPSPALDRYERRLFPRPDGGFVDCYISPPPFEEPTPLVFFCQGWGYASMFEGLPLGGYQDVNGWIFENSRFGDKIRLAFVEKRGVRFGAPLLDPEEQNLPAEFLRHDTKESRVADVLLALEELLKDPLVDRGKVALLGHGEGAVVAAAAARQCPDVTHLGYFASGGLPRIVELVALKREELEAAGSEPWEIEEAVEELFRDLDEACQDPLSLEPACFGRTPAHFLSFGRHPPLDDLLALEIPIFAAVGGADPHVPLFSADAIRAAFLCRGKENLTFTIYPGLDHGFTGPDPGQTGRKDLFQLPRVFDDFCAWFLFQADP